MARRWRSSRAARCSPRRRRTAATRRASAAHPRPRRTSPGRPTAARWSTPPIATAPGTCSSTTSRANTETRLTSGTRQRSLGRVLARRQSHRLRSRRQRAARPRCRDQAGALDRARRLRSAAVCRRAAVRLVAGQPLARVPVGRRQDVHQRPRRRPRRRRAPCGELPRQFIRQHHLVVGRMARRCTSTRASAPSCGRSRAST